MNRPAMDRNAGRAKRNRLDEFLRSLKRLKEKVKKDEGIQRLG